ncbi:hypothetical protein [Luteimonas sp. MC1750]|uniref:hypothetical protein n=1 Tax=Luteimonas sp. MC1750 TaxID=2799326 RepID=UPI0018F0807F|nr:hypothetical protein [Luteimonas sp. MC1750]MBJ6983994.1 hypothetical protein [Luteimonas sp. MC1750]QQO06806.1 hypothetical protein JGR68_05110 [Luteimonas sp. MC1750]
MDQHIEIFRKMLAISTLMGVSLPLVDDSSPSFKLLDATGVLPHLTGRVLDEKRAKALSADGHTSGSDFLQGSSGYYLKADIIGRTGSGRVCRALVSRVQQLDPDVGSACRAALLTDGKDGMFEVLQSTVRRADLNSLAQQQVHLPAQPRSYGRAM